VRAAWASVKALQEETKVLMNFPIFIGTKKQREKAKGVALRARKRPLTKWQIAQITREKEQRFLIVQELLFQESLTSQSPTKSPLKSPSKVKDSSPYKAPLEPLKELLKSSYLPPQPQLPVLKSSRGRTLKPVAKLRQ